MLFNKKNIKILAIIQLLITSSICIFFSSIEYIELPQVDIDFIDKILHLIAFFIYGISIQITIINIESLQKKIKKNYKFKIKLIVLIFGICFAASDEIHQYFTPGRSADILDWIADVLGIILSLFLYDNIYNLYLKIINKKEQ